MFLSILLLFIFIKRSFFSNFLHILCPFIVYFASFVDSIGNIHASRNLFYQLWKLTAICKMNEFLRRHFYVPFWEFVHLHIHFFLYTVCLFVSQESRLHLLCQFLLFLCSLSEYPDSEIILHQFCHAAIAFRFLADAGQKDICHMRLTFVHTDAFHIHLFRLIAGVVPVNQAASSPDGNFRCILPVAKAFPGCFSTAGNDFHQKES